MMKKYTLKSCLVLAACMSIAPWALSCVEKEESHFQGVHAFVVKTIPLQGDRGSALSPLTFATSFSEYGTCKEGRSCFDLIVGAYAVDIEGNFLRNYNDSVSVNAQPGRLNVNKLQFENGVVGEWVYDEAGNPKDLMQGVAVGLRYANGSTRIWLEDNQRQLKSSMPGAICPNNRETEDGVYCEPSMATGVSEEYVFEEQTIKMLQFNPDQPDGDSPLFKEYGQIKARKGHDLVVTNVVSTGFYITDLGDADYNSIFIFTYSQPARVDIGDRVCEVMGGVSEFTGMTQLQFPSWGIQNKERSTAEDTDPAPEDGDKGVNMCIDKETGEERECTQEELEAMSALVDCTDAYYDKDYLKELSKDKAAYKAFKKSFAVIESPEPKVLTPDILKIVQMSSTMNGKSIRSNPIQTYALENLEGSVVTLQNVRLSTEFINCDDNGNGKIDSNTEEADCRTDCQSNSSRCTELSNLDSYDQWKAWTIQDNAEISVASSSLIANFDITSGCYSWIDPKTNRYNMRCPERHLTRLTGNLKQILPGCSGGSECYASSFRPQMVMSVIEPRFASDLMQDIEFNAKAEAEFTRCMKDKGCLAACKEYGGACTCNDFAAYRARIPSSDPTAPKACEDTVTQ